MGIYYGRPKNKKNPFALQGYSWQKPKLSTFRTSRNTAVWVDKINVGLPKPISINHVFHPKPPKTYQARIDLRGGRRIDLQTGQFYRKKRW